MTRASGIVCLAAIGATTAVLWLSPAAAGDQTMPGATVESVVAVARRLNPTVAAASLDFDAAVHKIGTAGVLADPMLVLEAWDVNSLGVGQRRGAAQARNEALRLRIDGQIADAWFGVDALRKVVQIYVSRQLPPARSSVDNARNGFQAGSSDISMVFESERRLRAVQLDLLKLKVELQAKYAEMERLAGGSL